MHIAAGIVALGDENVFVAVVVGVLVAYALAAVLKAVLRRSDGRMRAWIWNCLTGPNPCASSSPNLSREATKPDLRMRIVVEVADGRRVEDFEPAMSTLRPIWGNSDRGRLCLRTAVVQKGSIACSQKLADLQLPERLGVAVMALWIGDVYYECPEPDHILQKGDRVVLLGTLGMVSVSSRLFQSMPFSAATDG